jgi:hypothetical protein
MGLAYDQPEVDGIHWQTGPGRMKSSTPLSYALVLAAAVQAPDASLLDFSNLKAVLQPGTLSILVGRLDTGGITSSPDNFDQSKSNRHIAQRFLNFRN